MNAPFFLFIIPLTPFDKLPEERKLLQKICFELLKKQTYKHWKALLIGEYIPENMDDENHFIHLNFNGTKELKLKVACEYIENNSIHTDYIIRLDDDDFINPFILSEIKNLDFDVFVDSYHHFLCYFRKKYTRQFRPWFPNTFIIRKKIALLKKEDLSVYELFENNQKYLIENEHHKIHHYFMIYKKKIKFNPMNYPVYLRTINLSSISASYSNDFQDYMNSFGIWNDLLDEDVTEIFKRKLKVKYKNFYTKLMDYLHYLIFRTKLQGYLELFS
jgi:hypothetical protein